MKKLLRLIFVIPLFIYLSLHLGVQAQTSSESEKEVIDNIHKALKSGSSKELIRHLNNPVELNLPDKQATYSNSQAEFVLRDFFSKYKATNFDYIHQGQSKEGLKYIIGKYSHAGGTFRVYMLIKELNGNFIVDTMDFSND